MTQQHNNHSSGSPLPHRRLHVYGKALELLAAVRAARVADATEVCTRELRALELFKIVQAGSGSENSEFSTCS